MTVLRNKSIIFLTPSLKAGGGNRVFVEIANHLGQYQDNISIYYPNNSKDKSHYCLNANVKLVPIGSLASGIVKKIVNVVLLLRKVKRILDVDKEAICVISDPIISIFYTLLIYSHKKRTYRFIQADDYRIFDDLYILRSKAILLIYKKLCLRSYHLLINYMFNSYFTYNQFKDLMPSSNVAIKLVHPGIDTAVFFNKNIRNDKALNISIIARKHPMKGFIDFITAWNLMDSSVKEQIDNIFVISHDDLTDFKLPNKVKIINPNSDVEISEIMNLAQIFVSTSWWEGFGLPPLEAMACGCALLSSNSKGILEYAVNGRNCMLYEPRNIDELTANLTQLISNVEMRNQLARAGAIDAQRFTWQNATNQFSTILSDN